MRKFIVLPLLVLLAACTDRGPIGPDGPDGPLFKKCSSPPCDKGGGGGGDAEGDYTITDLGTLTLAGGSWNVARDISGNGEVVVGASEDADGNSVATVWSLDGDGWDILALEQLSDFTGSEANAIDSLGIVTVGSAGFGTPVPVRWDLDLGILRLPGLVVNDTDFLNGVARDVNIAGQIVGWTASGNARRATLWEVDVLGKAVAAIAIELRTLIDGESSRAYGINEDGLIVGTDNSNDSHAVLWREGTDGFEICDLHPGDASWSRAYAITDAKLDGSVEVAGVRDNIVTVWSVDWPVKGPCVAAGSRDLSSGAFAFDINNRGEVVGQDLSSGTTRPVLWMADNQLVELPSVKGNYGSANRINDAGQIVGWSKGARKQVRAVLWTKNQ